ncbi:MAG: bifunctional isocitrate dehydrogenase kinase/phosphatase [Verrucomicrobiota bacterium]
MESSPTHPCQEAGGRIAREIALFLRDSFDDYSAEFLAITRRAKSRFENREWTGVLQDAQERIGLYHSHLNHISSRMQAALGPCVHDYSLWERVKTDYVEVCFERYDADLALIFFYSVMRRLFVETGDSIEYSDDEIRSSVKAQVEQDPNRPVRIYPADVPEDVTAELIQRIVGDFHFAAVFQDLPHDASLAAEMLRPTLRKALGTRKIDRIEVLESAFFRNKAAYLMGRVVSGSVVIPLVLVLLNRQEGIIIDSALSEEADLNNIFTSARSNFHTDTAAYREICEFLASIAPSRPKAYIFTAIGFIHPGKLQLVHELRRHLEQSGEKFCVARGVPGTVMVVFTLPTFRYVFKVIRDTSSKETFLGRQHVIAQYWKVHRMDRVGRMLDIMTFHNLRFRRSDFEPGLLGELLHQAPSSVRAEGEDVIFRYLYAERQITPLDVYLADPARPQEAKAKAAIDYGHAIKDLAAAGIFVGDYLPKNFGVNRLGRVLLYDYDDLDELVRWNFRELPDPPEWAEMLPYEEWLSKKEWDVFPEHDFRIFTVPAHEREVFLEHHRDVLIAGYWNSIKDQLQSGSVPEFYPYPQSKRLPARFGGEEGAHSRHVHPH